MQPFQQGKLDGLCGVYSLINCIKLLGYRYDFDGWLELFSHIFAYFKEQNKSFDLITDGITTPDISRVLKHVIQKTHSISYSKPCHSKHVTITELWDISRKFMNSDHTTTAILCISGKNYSHWTVVKDISARRMTLFDSDGVSWVNKINCTTVIDDLEDKKTVCILPSSLFFIERRQEK